MLILCGLMGITVTLAIFLSQGVASPVAVIISGISKDILLTYLGFVMFEDANFTPCMAAGLALSFIGAASYMVHNYRLIRKVPS